MRRSSVWAGVLAMVAGSTCMAQVDTPEVEPNESKAAATVVAAMAPGDTITGNTTGSSTTAGAATSVDYWNITTTAAPSPGIWQYTLTYSVNNTVTIRGLGQLSGVINSTDTTLQTSSSATNRIVRWYANEQPSQLYLNVTGTTATTANYVLTLARTQITPTALNSLSAGPVYVTTVNQGAPTTTDTEVWLYDSTFTPIVDAGNDNEPLPSGATQSRLWRNLPAGNYFLAMATQNLANNLASPADDRQRSRGVTDFPNVTCTSSAPASNDNQSFTIGNRCTGESQSVTDNTSQHYKIVTFYSFTLTGAGSPDPTAVTAAATPASVGQGQSTLLTATITGAPATAVAADLSAFGLTGAEVLHDDGVSGDTTAGDGVWSYALSVPAAQATGSYPINLNVTAPTSCIPPASATITLGVTPPNDLPCNAIPIQVGGNGIAGTTLGATSAGDPTATCNSLSPQNQGVWYTFTEPLSATPRVLRPNLCDPATDFDAKIIVYSGSCGALTCLGANDDSLYGCPYQAESEVIAGTAFTKTPSANFGCTVPGTTYYFLVANKTNNVGGNFVFHLDVEATSSCSGQPISHNLCPDARPLTTFPYWETARRLGATQNNPDVSCNEPSNTAARAGVWYTFTPSQNGDLYFTQILPQTAGSDTVLTIYTGADCSTQTEVLCLDALEAYALTAPHVFRAPVFQMTAGTTYRMMLSQFSSTVAAYTFTYLGFDFIPTGPSCPGNQCGPQDYNGDGDSGTDQDIEAFFACLGGNCCATCFCQGSDFNGDGDFGTDQDIEAFFRVLGGNNC